MPRPREPGPSEFAPTPEGGRQAVGSMPHLASFTPFFNSADIPGVFNVANFIYVFHETRLAKTVQGSVTHRPFILYPLRLERKLYRISPREKYRAAFAAAGARQTIMLSSANEWEQICSAFRGIVITSLLRKF
ncbi:hypothetical protein ACJJTC_001032 [Scirpophaga incertulas]